MREIGVDLGDITADTMKRLALDDVLFVRSLWLICEKQADERNITPADFGEALVGDCIDDAYEALRGALEDFFPKRKRNFFKRMMEADREVQVRAMEIGLEALTSPENRAQLTDAMTERVKEEVAQVLKRLRSATDSLGSSE